MVGGCGWFSHDSVWSLLLVILQMCLFKQVLVFGFCHFSIFSWFFMLLIFYICFHNQCTEFGASLTALFLWLTDSGQEVIVPFLLTASVFPGPSWVLWFGQELRSTHFTALKKKRNILLQLITATGVRKWISLESFPVAEHFHIFNTPPCMGYYFLAVSA